MNYKLRGAIDEWNDEVEEEAAKLIRFGTPPFDAMDQARNIVSTRRKQTIATTPRDLSSLFGGRHD